MPVQLSLLNMLPAISAIVIIAALILAVLAVRYYLVWAYNRRQDSYVKFLLDGDFTLYTLTLKEGGELRIVYFGVRKSGSITTAYCPEYDLRFMSSSKRMTKQGAAVVMRRHISKHLGA